MKHRIRHAAGAVATLSLCTAAFAAGTVGSTFPTGFPAIEDASLGKPLRQDRAERQVRRFVAIDGPNQGIINCSPNPANYFQAAAVGGFTPQSDVCQELGSPNTPFLKLLNGAHGDDDEHGGNDGGHSERSVRTLVIRNADTSFVFFPLPDGVIVPVPAEDSFGKPADFSRSAEIRGAEQLDLTGQDAYDPILGTTHLGILNSPRTREAMLEFLTAKPKRH